MEVKRRVNAVAVEIILKFMHKIKIHKSSVLIHKETAR